MSNRAAPNPPTVSRRRLLLGSALLTVPAIAGCSDSNDEESEPTDDAENDEEDGPNSSDSDEAPNAVFAYNLNTAEGWLEITMDGGDFIPAGRLSIEGSNIATGAQGATWADLSEDLGPDGQISAGDSITIEDATTAYEVTLTWESAEGATTAVISEESGPDA